MMLDAWFMPSDKIKCFSYVRWSSEKQTKGTSLERQLAKTKEFANKNNFEPASL
jgi:DNA invertase Pin-like site-specific DNA recombinase